MFANSFLLILACAFPQDPIAKYRAAAIERWEEEIQKLEQLDKQEADPDHAILFTGSSSIRRWTDMPKHMHPWATIRRGYGGARFSDLGVFIHRIVDPHEFDALVIFVGNDISGSERDKEPEEVLRLYQFIVSQVREKHALQPIFCIGVTPTSSRFDVWEQINQANQLIKEYSEATDNLYFIDTAQHYLDKQGKPRDELFVKDRLHLNEDGYLLWAKIIKGALSEVLPTPVGKQD